MGIVEPDSTEADDARRWVPASPAAVETWVRSSDEVGQRI